jgi:protein-disulfide isomerase
MEGAPVNRGAVQNSVQLLCQMGLYLLCLNTLQTLQDTVQSLFVPPALAYDSSRFSLFLFTKFSMATTTNGNNPWFASTVGLAGLIVGYVIATGVHGLDGASMGGNANVPTAPTPTAQTASVAPAATDTPPTVGSEDPVLGKADAPVTFIEFTDFQCPFCQRHFQQTFPDLKKNYVDTGKIKYVIRYFPLSFHPNAEKAAETAACSNDQGKFWEMHDKLFTTQNDWQGLDAAGAATAFKGYAKDIGLDVTKFNTCLDTSAKQSMIQKDEADGSGSLDQMVRTRKSAVRILTQHSRQRSTEC